MGVVSSLFDGIIAAPVATVPQELAQCRAACGSPGQNNDILWQALSLPILMGDAVTRWRVSSEHK